MAVKTEVLEIEVKRRIYNYILKHPGIHLRQISKELDMPLSTLKYHLNGLIKHELIAIQSESKYYRYYIKDKVGNNNKKIMPYLRQKVPLNIILYLLLWVGASQIELSRSIKKHPTTVEFHLKKLVDAGIIERLPVKDGIITIPRSDNIKALEYTPVSNEAVYKLVNPNEIYETLIIHKTSFFSDSSVNAVLDLIEDAIADGRLKKRPEKTVKTRFNKRVDEGMEHIYEIFPHPYHV
jgi:DNA-binding MarR family transcriptional regulator